MDIAYTRVFAENFNAKERIVVNSGGARSTKTYSILQLFAYKLITEQNKIFLITRKNFPSLRRTAYNDFIQILKDWGIYNKNNHSKEQGNHHYQHNTNIVYFISIDDPNKMRSFKCNYAFFEEANDFDFEDFFQVFLRTNNPTKFQWRYPIAAEPINEGDTVYIDENNFAYKKRLTNIYAKESKQKGEVILCKDIIEPNQVFLALNPDEEHNYIWDIIVDKFPKLEKNPISVKVIHSTYKDNPFLDESYIASLEATKYFNDDYYKIYALGQRVKLKGMIHPDYEISNDDMPDDDTFDSIAFGIDFGGSAPSCLLKLGFRKTEPKPTVYVQELIYQSYLRTSELIDICKKSLTKKTLHAPFYCDSASPERIEEMKRAGLNAIPATDVKKSIEFGWDIVNDHHLIITASSINTAEEIKKYVRKKDKNGNFINEEVPGIPNHAMAALRYGIGQHRHEIYTRNKSIVSINTMSIIEQKLKESEKEHIKRAINTKEQEEKIKKIERIEKENIEKLEIPQENKIGSLIILETPTKPQKQRLLIEKKFM